MAKELSKAETTARAAVFNRFGGIGHHTANNIVKQAEAKVQREFIISLIGEDRYWSLVETEIRT